MSVRVQSDVGAPVVVSHPKGPAAQTYVGMANRVHALLQQAAAAPPAGPRITVE
jgi:hypothetical protein